MAGGGGESEVGFTARSATSVCGAASPLSLSRPLGRIIFQSAPLGFELLVLLIPGRGAAGHAGRVAVAGLLPALPSVDSIAVVALRATSSVHCSSTWVRCGGGGGGGCDRCCRCRRRRRRRRTSPRTDISVQNVDASAKRRATNCGENFPRTRESSNAPKRWRRRATCRRRRGIPTPGRRWCVGEWRRKLAGASNRANWRTANRVHTVTTNRSSRPRARSRFRGCRADLRPGKAFPTALVYLAGRLWRSSAQNCPCTALGNGKAALVWVPLNVRMF
ncbi:putative protamine [Trichinella spiralis]|uniref:putative protamine n=1 Tax=Trichinella spiralis TaxID=6334 RepID=UPI0001EFDBED|nr:putative protamine [Trichinella spiralis]